MTNRRKIIKRISSVLLMAPFASLFKIKAKPMQEQVPDQKFFELDRVYADLQASGKVYNPFLNVPKLNTGLYVLKAGTEDRQSPHALDEVYYVISGKAMFKSGNETTEAGPGSIIYVKAQVEHRFYDIKEELKVLVFFSEMK